MKIQCVVQSKHIDTWGKIWLNITMPPTPPSENVPGNVPVQQQSEPGAYINVPADQFPGVDVGATVQVEVSLA